MSTQAAVKTNYLNTDKIDLFEDLKKLTKQLYGNSYDKNYGPTVTHKDKEIIMMGAVNYLGLSHHPLVMEASLKALQEYGAGGIGSRYSNGCLKLYNHLDERIIDFIGREDCAFFNSGYMANLGAVSTFGKNAIIFSDKENHLSLYDACKLSGYKYIRFRHNDPAHLDQALSQYSNYDNKWIILVGTFGVTGENIKLKQIVEVAKIHNARIYLDDAHAIGIYGKNKKGLSELYGLENQIDLIMTSFQMAFGNIGAFVAGDTDQINQIKWFARPYIFSFTIPPINATGILKALDIIQSNEGDELISTLLSSSKKLRTELRKKGLNIVSDDHHIVSILVGDEAKTIAITEEMFNTGLWVQKYIHPSVPKGQATIRFTCMSSHTDEHIDKVVEITTKTSQKHGII
jgi:8-amino-7-oxononanoate synthase